jgi:hypothetical protein
MFKAKSTMDTLTDYEARMLPVAAGSSCLNCSNPVSIIFFKKGEDGGLEANQLVLCAPCAESDHITSEMADALLQMKAGPKKQTGTAVDISGWPSEFKMFRLLTEDEKKAPVYCTSRIQKLLRSHQIFFRLFLSKNI